MVVLNVHIVGIVRKIHRYRYEMVKSVSNSQSGVSDADFQRFKSFITDFRSYLAEVISQPAMDAPKASPKEYTLPVAESLPDPDNDAILEMKNYWDLLEEEISKSNSNAIASGLSVFDHSRIVAMVDRIEQFLDRYVSNVLPVDFVESMPLRKVTGEGRNSQTGGTNLPG